MDTIFSALADPTRRAILARLRTGPSPVGALVAEVGLAGPTVTRHLDVLERAQLIRRTKRGQSRICSLDPAGFRAAADWLSDYETFWATSLDRLAGLIATEDDDDGHDDASG